jgi:hypothetical protein
VYTPRRRIIGWLVLAPVALTGCWSRDEGRTAEADPYRCHAGNVDYRLPTDTLTDWVSYSDQLSVVEVTAEHRGEPSRPEPGSDEAPWVGRRVDLQVLETPWRRAEAPTAPDTLTVQVDPWRVRKGRLRQFRVSDGPWVEVGQRYLMGLVRLDEGDWGPYAGSTMPLSPAGVVVATCQDHTTLARFTGLTPDDAAAVLAKTPIDPIASANSTLPPIQRWQRAAAARPAGPPDVIDFVCAANGSAQALYPEALAQGDGIHVRIRNETGAPVVYRYDSPAGPGGGQQVPPGESTDILYLVPPGPVRLRCGQDTNEKTAPATTVEVRDPAGFYRNLNVDEGLRCKITEYISDRWTAPFPTAEAALDALVADLGRKITLSPGPGYKAVPDQTYLVYRDGRGYGLAETHAVDGRYRAGISQRCG